MQFQRVNQVLESWLTELWEGQFWQNTDLELPLFFTTQSLESDHRNFVVASLLLKSSSARTLSHPILYETKGQLEFQIFLSSENTTRIFALIDQLNQSIFYQELKITSIQEKNKGSDLSDETKVIDPMESKENTKEDTNQETIEAKQPSSYLGTLRFSTGSFRYVGEEEGKVQHHASYPWTLHH